MTEIRFNCPGCSAALRTSNPDLAGKKIRCPKCGEVSRIPAANGQKAAATPPPVPATEAGRRVFAQWHDGFWYPATVRGTGSRGLLVEYDDGEAGNVTPEQVRDLALAEGDRVQCRWRGEPGYYPGKVIRVSGDKLVVHYDDGAKETTTIGMVRVIRDEDIPWKPGDRVLANWEPEPFFYPATVRGVEDGFIAVDYDDGDRAELLSVQVMPLDLREGDPVFARKDDRMYYPGQISRMKGEKILVAFEDGGEEWTTVRVVRVLPGRPAPGGQA